MKQTTSVKLGITGSYGMGKSTVGSMFKELGYEVIDADKVAKSLQDTILFTSLVKEFGQKILRKGRIDNRKLSKIVFSDNLKLKRLNKICLKPIIEEIKSKIKQSKVIALEAPVLLESGSKALVDKVIVVKCKREIVLRRLRHIPRQKILQIWKNQMPVADKLKHADFVIDNSESLNKTKKQVEKIDRLIH